MAVQLDLMKLSKRKHTDMVGLRFELCAQQDFVLRAHYAKGLHAWFLNQIQDYNPPLSTYLHDGQSEKPFSMSRLGGGTVAENLRLVAGDRHEWSLHLLSPEAVDGVLAWLWAVKPSLLWLGSGKVTELTIERVSVSLQPNTYQGLWRKKLRDKVTLSFLSPTGFRRRGGHLPLPLPRNIFQSYLRRWQDFSGFAVETNNFLDWVDEFVVIRQHRIETRSVAAGKAGAVTGFIGSVQFAVRPEGKNQKNFWCLFSALGSFAPYCGTGHKTSFGLGFTVSGQVDLPVLIDLDEQLFLQRVESLRELFSAQRQKYQGDRTQRITELWALIFARRERGESLQDIAFDLGIHYETAKTYLKRARRSLSNLEYDHSE
ncbi:CRISPR-associated endoribonuclease Cas6 [[Limnothrix rosea] IAM M-220]|uniref:CRISPR-associated endoribonuclease Cas6 n=1 Tax=[Limnothrix rosea] IAM M-220 TaxID=454133 RepID=UPI00096960EC|nr:CRISPR-associated endoribonuclease Cas6 [[Limnothrix rosea] IAM M-220]OKH18645.1 CRISPR-associated endoribonuclease Cas6 [[Limnothrix rosea] IAM M-220]